MNRQNLVFGAGVVVWSILVFAVTFYLTFPSDALVARIKEEAPNVLGPDYEVDLASAAPWWVGLSMTDVAVSQRARNWRRDPEAESSLVAFAPKARVRTSLFSLLTQAPSVIGAVTLGDGRVDFDVTTKSGERQLEIATLEAVADQLPLADVVGSPLMASALGGFSMVGDGAVDLNIDLQAGERGMADGVGQFELQGRDLMLSELSSETTGPLGIDVPIRKLEIVAEVEEGKGDLKEGIIDSDLFKLKISGDFGLRDPLTNSTINFEVELSDISKDLSLVETMLRSGLGASADNGKYKFTCRGMIARLNSRTCRSAGSRRRPSTGRSSANKRTPVRSRPSSVSRAERPKVNDPDRERRREEIRERLRARAGNVDQEEADELDFEEEDEEALEEELEELDYEEFEEEE
ncbi:MAG: type II secretion system protein GspN [Myxococcota bacterium]